MNTLTILKQSGLTQKEGKVYLASLELGPASISQIARKSRLKRPTVYLAMNELIKRNYIIKILKGRRTFYRVENPELLATNLREKLVKLENIVPELVSLYQNPPQKTKIRFYEGREEVKRIYWEAASSGKDFICCFSYKNYSRLTHKKEELDELLKYISKKKAKIKDLVEDSVESRAYARKKMRMKIGGTKFLPKNIKIKTDTFVYDNKVVLISFSSMTATVIEDQDIADTQRNFLKFMWKNL